MITQTPHGSTKATASKKRKRLKKIHVDQAENGGYVVKHHFHPEHGGTPAPETHAFASYDDAHAHLDQALRGHRG